MKVKLSYCQAKELLEKAVKGATKKESPYLEYFLQRQLDMLCAEDEFLPYASVEFSQDDLKTIKEALEPDED